MKFNTEQSVHYIVFAMKNESTMVNSKKIQMLYYCLHCNARSNNLSDLTGPRGATSIDINMDITHKNVYKKYGSMA